MEKKTAARLEGRPKVPVGTYHVTLAAGDTEASVVDMNCPPDQKPDIQWLLDASIRLDGNDMPGVSNVWLSASQTKGLAGIKPQAPPVSNNSMDAYDGYEE